MLWAHQNRNSNVEDSHWFKLKKRCLLRLSWKSGAANSLVSLHRYTGSDRKSPQRDGTKYPERTEVGQISPMNLGCSLLPIFFSSYNMDLPLKMKCPLVYLLKFTETGSSQECKVVWTSWMVCQYSQTIPCSTFNICANKIWILHIIKSINDFLKSWYHSDPMHGFIPLMYNVHHKSHEKRIHF